jgi:Kef-type K+ transport system membrane component KefB
VGFDAVPALLLCLVVIVVVARLLGRLARRLGQPAVIGEILGGILLGPTLLDGAVTRTLFPAETRPALAAIADVGVCVFMFLIGLHVDRGLLRGQARLASTVALAAVALPFGLGALLALHLHGNHPTDHKLAFVLFLGTAMSVTAFPVLARILTDRGLLDTPIGGLALACAAVGDVLAWTLLAVVVALADGGADPWRVALVVPFAAVLLRLVKPRLARLAEWRGEGGRLTGAGMLAAAGAGLFLSAAATEWMGLHAIFGAFLFGIAMPRQEAPAWLARLTAVLLLPVVFMVAGLGVDLSRLDLTALGELGLILLVAIGGKVGGVLGAARLSGVRWRPASTLAILVNTRGLTELVVLTVGLQLAVIDQGLYSLMVMMALVTTALAGVLLPLVQPASPDRAVEAAPQRERSVS